MRAVVFRGAGGNEVVQVQERPEPTVAADEVMVGVVVAGTNPADIEQREGRYPAPPGAVPDVPGLEVAGVVLAVGSEVTAWRPGDREFGLVGGGGLADRVAVHERCIVAVPDMLSDEQAAAVPEGFITAHDALMQAELSAGETVLVRGATGGVGSAAVQIALGLGATVFAPVGNADAERAVRSLGAHPLPADAVRDTIMAHTGDRGVDIVLELVGGAGVREDLDVLALRGRIVVVSVAAGARVELDLHRLMVRRAAIRGTVLRARSLEEKAAAVLAFHEQVVPMLSDGRAVASIDSVFPVEEIGRAFDRLVQRGKRGKVLVSFR